MIKNIALLRSRPDMTRDSFVLRYETGHAPLVRRLLPNLCGYRRTYVVRGGDAAPDHLEPTSGPDFDVLTEIWYPDRTELERTREPSFRKAIEEDERALFDRDGTVILPVIEQVTPVERLAPAPAGTESPPVKMLILLKRKPHLTADEFIDGYENGHCELALDLLRKADGTSVFARYVRSYVDTTLTSAGSLPCDVVTELGFWSEADHETFIQLCAQPENATRLIEDEERWFERGDMTIFFGEEHDG